MIFIFRILLILLVSSCLYAGSALKEEKVSIQLLWLDQFEFAGFYIAKEKGFYKEAGLDVEIKPFRDGMKISKDVSEGKTTYGIANSSILVDRSKGMPIVAIGAILQSSPRGIAVKKSSNIFTINDLKNKKIMLTDDYENDVLIMAMLTSKGLKKDDFTVLPQSHNINDLIDDKIDAMMIYTSNQPFLLREKGVETTIFKPREYGFDCYADILYTSEYEIKNHPERTRAFYEATMRGWQYAFEHTDESVELILKKYNSQKKSKAALMYEAKELKKLSGLYTKKFGKLHIDRLKATESIYHLMGIITANIDMNQFTWQDASVGKSDIIFLTEEEKKYLQTKKKITMCVDPDWPPFEAIENGRHVGLSADYMDHFSKILQTPIVLIPTKNWHESLSFAQQRKCEILSMAMETEKRRHYMNFTRPYLTANVVFATRMEQSFIPEFEEIISEKIGVSRADGLIETLQKAYPGIHLVEVDSIEQGLANVASGELFAFVDTFSAVSYHIAENFQNELKIGGKIDQSRELRIAVSKDDRILLNLFDKAIASVSEDMKNEIKGRWVSVKYEKGTDYNLIIKISLLFITLLLLLLVWNQKLKRLNKKIEQLSVCDELSGLYNRRYFNTKFMEIYSDVINKREYFFFILLDIDNFKRYNDRYGHLKGDNVIASVGKTLNTLFNRSTDIAFRLGGEEFGCFGSSDSKEGALKKAEEIRQYIEALCIEHKDNLPFGVVTVSGGIVILFSDSPKEVQEIIYHRADNALYQAKELGKNRIIQSVL